MAQDFAKRFYNSTAWQKCRASFISERQAIDGGVCQQCNNELGYIVHHRIRLTPENIHNPDITLNHKNFEYVCQDCHNRIEKSEDGARYYFDDTGQLIPIPPPLRIAIP